MTRNSETMIPRYSLAVLLALMTGAAVFSVFVLRAAVDGESGALGVVVGLGSLALALVVYAVTFLGVWLVSLVLARLRGPEKPDSPFATAKLPPRVIAPTAPES